MVQNNWGFGSGPGKGNTHVVRITAICIGDELLNGDTLNTNLLFLGRELAAAGYDIQREICIPDAAEVIRDTLLELLPRSDLLITVGGLGPTEDDRTRAVVAEVMGMPLKHHEPTETHIRSLLQGRNVRVPESAVLAQCLVPAGAEVITNRNGTAPALWCRSSDGRAIVMLPGPPREFEPMITGDILPRIQANWSPSVASRVIRAVGMPESCVEETITPALLASPRVRVAYCAKPESITVRITAPCDCTGILDDTEQHIRELLGSHALPGGCPSLAHAVGDLLVTANLRMATAESCTGGGIAAALTDIPGSSRYFDGGIVTYSNEWKHNELGVPREILDTYGAVSEETVSAMLNGTMKRAGVGAAVAVSGIAGPDGGTDAKPVGLVYIGIAVGSCAAVHRFVFPGDRDSVRRRTVSTALRLLRDELTEQLADSRLNDETNGETHGKEI